MNLKDIFNISLINIRRNRNNRFYVIVMSFCILQLITMIFFIYNFGMLYIDTVVRNISFRSLSVSPNIDIEHFEQNKKDLKWTDYLDYSYQSDIQKILEIDNVDDSYVGLYRNLISETSSFKNKNLTGTINFLYGSKNLLPKIIKGRTINKGERGVAICPKYFYPSSLDSNSLYIPILNKSYMLKGNDILNTSFTATYNIYNNELDATDYDIKSFEIVGIYDSTKTMNSYMDCYISPEDIIEMTHTQNLNNNQYDETDSYSYSAIDVVINSSSNVQSVFKELKKLGYQVSMNGEMDYELIMTITISSIIIIGVISSVIVILTSSYIKKKIIKETNTIGMYKAYGYNKKDITKIYVFETWIINMISFLISTIIFFIMYFIFSQSAFYGGLMYLGTYISTNILIFIASLLIIFISTFVNIKDRLSSTLKSDITLLIGSKE